MNKEMKICKFCKHENYYDNSKCVHCGRFFTVDDPTIDPLKNNSETISNSPTKNDYLKLIPPIALLISLFLPWLSWFIVKISAFDIGNFIRVSIRIADRSTLSLSLIQIFIYMIPIGSIFFIFRSITGQTIKVTGIITGSLPILILVLTLTQTTELLQMVSAGFIIAVFSGIALISISVKKY